MNHKRVVSLAISREFATRFVNEPLVLFPRSWLHNPRTCLKILPRTNHSIHKIYKKSVIARRIVDSPKQSTPIVILSVAKYPNKINLRVAQQFKSFCYFWLSPKVESPLLSRHCEAIQQIAEAIQKST